MRGPSPGLVVCTECKKVHFGGINRLKYHLAGITHHDVEPYLGASKEIKREMNALLAATEEKKLQRERTKAAIAETIASGHGHEQVEIVSIR